MLGGVKIFNKIKRIPKKHGYIIRQDMLSEQINEAA